MTGQDFKITLQPNGQDFMSEPQAVTPLTKGMRELGVAFGIAGSMNALCDAVESAESQIAELKRERDDLKHDIERHVAIASSEAERAEKAERERDEARATCANSQNAVIYKLIARAEAAERSVAALREALKELVRLQVFPSSPMTQGEIAIWEGEWRNAWDAARRALSGQDLSKTLEPNGQESVREQVIEECAKVCEKEMREAEADYESDGGADYLAEAQMAANCAAEIRALKQEKP